MIEGPEVEPHRHRTGHSRIDLIIGCLAVMMSCVSIFIAVRHGRTMERLVEANSWPNLSMGSSNANETGTNDDITLDFTNTGVGPARVDSVQLFYKGVLQPTATALWKSCCAPAHVASFGTSKLVDEVLPARSTITLLRLPRKPNGDAAWTTLDAARAHIDMRACYCSVFEECWIRDTRASRPEVVEHCEVPQDGSFKERE